MENELKEYSKMIDDFAWYNKGDLTKIAQMAKKLNRSYTQDIAERKMAIIKPKS